jgi:hypothetical protein
MNLNFWDGVIMSSVFWMIISVVCLVRGLWVGMMDDNHSDWATGYEEGWRAALQIYMPEILEKGDGMIV